MDLEIDGDGTQGELGCNMWSLLVVIAAAITWLGSQIDFLLMIGGFILVIVFMIMLLRQNRQKQSL